MDRQQVKLSSVPLLSSGHRDTKDRVTCSKNFWNTDHTHVKDTGTSN